MREALGRIQAAAKRTGGYSRSVLADDLREVVARVAQLEGVIQTQNGVVVSGTLKLNEARARVAKLEEALISMTKGKRTGSPQIRTTWNLRM